MTSPPIVSPPLGLEPLRCLSRRRLHSRRGSPPSRRASLLLQKSMASSSSAAASAAALEAVQVLVASLADDSPRVRDSALAALRDIAPLNPLLVLDCCATISRGGHRRFANMAGVFLVMASAVRALDRWDAEREFLRKIAKIATAEIVSSKAWDAVTLPPCLVSAQYTRRTSMLIGKEQQLLF